MIIVLLVVMLVLFGGCCGDISSKCTIQTGIKWYDIQAVFDALDPCTPNPCPKGQVCRVDEGTYQHYCQVCEATNNTKGGHSECSHTSSFENLLLMHYTGFYRALPWLRQSPKDRVNIPTNKPAYGDPCNPNPCRFGGNCFANAVKQDYYCQCPYPTGGKSCEKDLTCSQCARQDDLVIYVFNDETVTMGIAEARCNSMGYRIHMPKTQDVYNFTRTYLFNNYPRNTPRMQGYRIGLSRASSAVNWMWADGTQLGSYRPWAPGQPTTELCVTLWNNPSFQQDWDDYKCALSPHYDFYFVCEKRYDFFNWMQ